MTTITISTDNAKGHKPETLLEYAPVDLLQVFAHRVNAPCPNCEIMLRNNIKIVGRPVQCVGRTREPATVFKSSG